MRPVPGGGPGPLGGCRDRQGTMPTPAPLNLATSEAVRKQDPLLHRALRTARLLPFLAAAQTCDISCTIQPVDPILQVSSIAHSQPASTPCLLAPCRRPRTLPPRPPHPPQQAGSASRPPARPVAWLRFAVYPATKTAHVKSNNNKKYSTLFPQCCCFFLPLQSPSLT